MLQRLDSELPGHYTVPTGSRITIRYHEDNPPVLAVRMQEMFGEASTAGRLRRGRVPLGAGTAFAGAAAATNYARFKRFLAGGVSRSAKRG
ncbi:ATP-dependent helicase HrpB [Salmonella bongori]|nr:ATP-dependent helicase HrpB [Salmonella bongori]